MPGWCREIEAIPDRHFLSFIISIAYHDIDIMYAQGYASQYISLEVDNENNQNRCDFPIVHYADIILRLRRG